MFVILIRRYQLSVLFCYSYDCSSKKVNAKTFDEKEDGGLLSSMLLLLLLSVFSSCQVSEIVVVCFNCLSFEGLTVGF